MVMCLDDGTQRFTWVVSLAAGYDNPADDGGTTDLGVMHLYQQTSCTELMNISTLPIITCSV